MPRPSQWLIAGQVVTRADVRRWCQSIGARISPANHWQYVRDYRVIQKIAEAKASGVLDTLIDQAAQNAGVRVRKPRQPGALARARLLPAANDPRFNGP